VPVQAMTEALPAAAHAAHLTEALRRSGALGNRRVRDVAVESARNTILSRIIRLRLSYDGTADAAPKSVILKTGLPDRAGNGWSGGRQEVAFYTQIASALHTRLVPGCYDAHWDAEQDRWHLLLEDLTESHVIATAWPLPPAVEQCQVIVRARARFHAAWWDDARLGTTVGTWSDDDAMERYLQRLADALKRFTDRLGDRLPRERRELYDRLLVAAPRLFDRYRSHRNVTIVQGDAHVWNCFLPKAVNDDDVRFFDWDCWRIDTGSDDLAYMMAMHWYPDRRRILERPLLDLYHATLVAHGIAYDRQALDEDYRLSVLWQITTPVWQAGNNIPPVIWWNNLERIFLAVDDLGCRDLLT
jgi:Ecdysteroid kinase-like family